MQEKHFFGPQEQQAGQRSGLYFLVEFKPATDTVVAS